MSNALCKLAVLFFALAFPFGAAAQVQFGTGIICDTSEQVEAFAAHSADGPDKALAFVNETVGETACGIVPVAFIEGPEAKKISDGRIVEIVIVAVNLGLG